MNFLMQVACAAAAVPPINPATLFAAGEKGAWYDPSDMATMFQDAAGTIAVTAAGQPVGKILDKSGNLNHLEMPTDIRRPVLRQTGDGYWYLEGNATYRIESQALIPMASPAEYGVFSAGYGTSGAGDGNLYNIAINLGGAGRQTLGLNPTTAVTGASFRSQFDGAVTLDAPYAGGAARVFATHFNLPAAADLQAAVDIDVNGAAAAFTVTASAGVGLASAGDMYVSLLAEYGGGSYLNGRLYGFILRNVRSTAAEIAGTNAYMNSKCGAY